MHSEDLERNMKLWEGGGQPPENNGGSSNRETYDKKDDDDNQTTTVREIPTSPAALNGLTVAGLASAASANDEVDSEIGDGGGGGLPEEDWKTAATAEEEVWAAANSRIFSHEVGGSQKRSLVPDLPAAGDGGRRNLGLSIFAGYAQAEEEAVGALRSAHNKVRFTSLICKDDDLSLSFIRIMSCYAQSINL
jgi:hypothetical protein